MVNSLCYSWRHQIRCRHRFLDASRVTAFLRAAAPASRWRQGKIFCPAAVLLRQLQVTSRNFALLATLKLVFQLVALARLLQACTLDVRNMQEDVLGAIIGLDEAKALGGVEPFDGTGGHGGVPFMTEFRTARLLDGSNFEGRRTPGSALNHEQGEQAEPNELMVHRWGACPPHATLFFNVVAIRRSHPWPPRECSDRSPGR